MRRFIDTFRRVAPDSTQHLTDENEREFWSSEVEFILTCSSLCIGTGNIIRFPYYAYRNGGGAFLFLYLIMIIVVGTPFYFLELCLGQYSGGGPTAAFRCVKITLGLGISLVLVCLITTMSYSVITAYALYYLFVSFSWELPWQRCDPAWSNDSCYVLKVEKIIWKQKEYSFQNFPSNISLITSSEFYWRNYVLGETSGIYDLGELRWSLSLALFFSWFCVALSLIRGVSSIGKLAYVTTTAPIIILLIFLIMGFTLKGSLDGLSFLILPHWNSFFLAKVWNAAASQTLYSLTVCYGATIMLASYNKFNYNVQRTAIVVTLMDILVNFLSAVVTFSILGYVSFVSNQNIGETLKPDLGMAFITYTQAVSSFIVSPLWSILFFLMLFQLSLGTQIPFLVTVVSELYDNFPLLRHHKFKLICGITIFCYVCSLPCATSGGQYVLHLMIFYGSDFIALILGLLEISTISYLYGINRITEEFYFMLGFPIGLYWRITWFVISPGVLLFTLVYFFIHFELLSTSPSYPYWSDIIGWLITLTILIPIPIVAIVEIYKQAGPGLLNKIKQATMPNPDWIRNDPLTIEKRRSWLKPDSESSEEESNEETVI